MNARAARRQQDGPPGWVDILLASTLASWGVVMVAITALALLQVATDFRPDALFFFLGTLFGGGGITFFIAIFASVILGLPALGLARLLRLDAWWQAMLLGALAGLCFVAVVPGFAALGVSAFSIAYVVVLVVAGALAGGAAWRERKKRDQPT